MKPAGVLTSLTTFRPTREWLRTILLSAIVGILAGLGAVALEALLEFGSHHLIGQFTQLGGPQVFDFRWEILLLPAVGCLASGLLVAWLSPHNYAHGTSIFTRAFHRTGGKLPLRGPAVKALASVGTIACGGSAGPEGPIAALGAAFGSTIGRLFKVTPRERRTLLIAGTAGGVGAIFQCPLGGALFAAEILYSDPELETQGLMSALIASVISYSTFMAFWGYGEPLLQGTQSLVFQHPAELLPYGLLGVAAGLTGILFYYLHHSMDRLVTRAYVPRWVYLLLGGLLVGAIACAIPQVMDSQYVVIQHALDGSFFTMGTSHPWLWWGFFFLLITVAKCTATVLTVGSGASGGMLGPSVFIGGALGAAVGAFMMAIAPDVMTESLRASLIPVGMAGVLAATMRIPLASIIMISEMTGSYGLLVPLMLVCVTAYLVGRRWGLNAEQVSSMVESPAHTGDAMVNMLENWRAGDVMSPDWPEICAPHTTLGAIISNIQPGTRPHIAVLQEKRLVGVISTSDVRNAMDLPAIAQLVVAADIMTPNPVAIRPGDDLYSVLKIFKDRNVDALPVVSEDSGKIFLSMLSRAEIHQAVRRRLLARREHLLQEHAGIAAIAHDEQMHLLMSDFPVKEGTPFQRRAVPPEVVGQSLRAADFHNRFRLQVIAVLTADGKVLTPPDPDRALQATDNLLVIEDAKG